MANQKSLWYKGFKSMFFFALFPKTAQIPCSLIYITGQPEKQMVGIMFYTQQQTHLTMKVN